MIGEIILLASLWHHKPHHPPNFYLTASAHPYLRVRLPECPIMERFEGVKRKHTILVVHLNDGCTFNLLAHKEPVDIHIDTLLDLAPEVTE